MTNNILRITHDNKTLTFDMNNERDRELFETLKTVGAGTHQHMQIDDTPQQTQYKTGLSDNILAIMKKNIFDHYRIEESDLIAVYDKLYDELPKRNVKVQYSDLSNVVEEAGGDKADHIETAIADGDTIYLHNNLGDHGGIATRLFDVMHLGVGHMIQRAADESSGLEFWGDNAYTIGSVFHNGASEETLQQVHAYEKEAHRLGLCTLQKILASCTFASQETADNIYRMYNDYCANDLVFIMDYYRTGKSKNFFAEWEFFEDQQLELLHIPSHIRAKKRPMIQIGVVRDNN